MSKSYDKIDGKKVREQYFRSERRESKRKHRPTDVEQLATAFDKAVEIVGEYKVARSLTDDPV